MSGSQTPIFGRLRRFFRPIHEDPKPLIRNPTRQTREENLVLPVHFSGDFSDGISGFSGGFSMKILGVISYSL
jgi:hypothetical protein